MNVGDVLNGYRIVTPPSNTGGGMSRWSFAERNGQEYFVKMFLAPRYPLPELPGSEEVKARKREVCARFEHRHLEIAQRLAGELDGGSNLVIPRDFFRVGATYVKVMDRVRPDPLPPRDALSDRQVLVLLRTLCLGLRVLHSHGIVHGDIKPDNVMTQRRGEVYVARLIDFDEAYVAGSPPESHLMVGDPAYYAPEHLAYVKGLAQGSALGLACDMFAVGLLFHVLIAGSMPHFDPEVATYPSEVLLNGGRLGLGPMPPAILDLVEALLAADPADRPTVEEVTDVLVDLPEDAMDAPPATREGAPPTAVGPAPSVPPTRSVGPHPATPAPTPPPTTPPPATAAPTTPAPSREGPTTLRSTIGKRSRPKPTET